MDIKAYYVSPLGRARKTADYTLDKAGRTAETLDWAREFDTLIDDKNGGKRIAWDWLPAEWMNVPEYFDKDKWYTTPIMASAGMEDGIRYV